MARFFVRVENSRHKPYTRKARAGIVMFFDTFLFFGIRSTIFNSYRHYSRTTYYQRNPRNQNIKERITV